MDPPKPKKRRFETRRRFEKRLAEHEAGLAREKQRMGEDLADREKRRKEHQEAAEVAQRKCAERCKPYDDAIASLRAELKDLLGVPDADDRVDP
jgi:hypothetical protein